MLHKTRPRQPLLVNGGSPSGRARRQFLFLVVQALTGNKEESWAYMYRKYSKEQVLLKKVGWNEMMPTPPGPYLIESSSRLSREACLSRVENVSAVNNLSAKGSKNRYTRVIRRTRPRNLRPRWQPGTVVVII
jgi:hypothetical protein